MKDREKDRDRSKEDAWGSQIYHFDDNVIGAGGGFKKGKKMHDKSTNNRGS